MLFPSVCVLAISIHTSHFDATAYCLTVFKLFIAGRNRSVGSVLALLSCMMEYHGFEPPLSLWQRRFSLADNIGSDSIP